MEAKQDRPRSIAEFFRNLPADHRAALRRVRAVILANLPKGYAEMMLFGMISYVVPFERFPSTYNGQPLMLAALGSQKNHMALYLMSAYGDSTLARWFKAEYRKSGKKLDMGKACVRFRKVEDLSLELVGEMIARVPVETYLKTYEESRRKKV